MNALERRVRDVTHIYLRGTTDDYRAAYDLLPELEAAYHRAVEDAAWLREELQTAQEDLRHMEHAAEQRDANARLAGRWV